MNLQLLEFMRFFTPMKLKHAFLGIILYPLFCIGAETANKASVNPNEIHHYKLRNGLTLLVKEDHRSSAVVSTVWYRVGSAYEPSGLTGISHALEHMMFQGTPKFPSGKFSRIISENGGEENAMTSSDFTIYFETLDHSLLPLAFQLESDRMQHLSLKAENFNKEIEVVREERRMRTDDNPIALTYERFMAAAYLSTPYHNPTIGWPDDLSQLTIEDLRQWYRTWYAPDNATIVVVGDVEPEKVYQLARQYFERIPARPLPPFKHHFEPPALGERHIIVKKGAKEPLLMMGYVVPSRATDPSSWKPYALTLLSAVLSGGNSARLNIDLVQNQQIASQVEVEYDMVSLYQAPFLFFVTPSAKHPLSQVKDALLKEIKALQTKPISEKELDKVRNQLIAQKIYARDSIFEQAMDIGSMASIGLSAENVETDIEKLKAITPKQIQHVAQEYLQSNRMTVAALVPQSLKPTEENNMPMLQAGGAIR